MVRLTNSMNAMEFPSIRALTGAGRCVTQAPRMSKPVPLGVQVDLEVLLLPGLTDAASISSAICSKAEELDAFAVVVSGHHTNMLTKLFYGSVCDSVMQACAVPVCLLH